MPGSPYGLARCHIGLFVLKGWHSVAFLQPTFHPFSLLLALIKVSAPVRAIDTASMKEVTKSFDALLLSIMDSVNIDDKIKRSLLNLLVKTLED